MNYEKAKLANGVIYDIAPNGFNCKEDELKLIIVMGTKTLTQIDAETDISTNVERIELLDTGNAVSDIKKGYIYQSGCEKRKDYIIGRESYQNGTDKSGMPVMDYRDVIGTVAIVTLKKSNIRKELNDVKDTVDMLVISSLGV